MENFLIMESDYKELTLKGGKLVKWSSGYWIHGQVENWETLDIGDYVTKWLCGQSGLEDASKEAT
jgi:hypothetical protein